jgi:hypothetical protein
MEKYSKKHMLKFKYAPLLMALSIAVPTSSYAQNSNSFSATCNGLFGKVKIAYVKEINQIKLITYTSQNSAEISTYSNPKINLDNIIFSNSVNGKSQIYVLDRKSGNLNIEVLNGFAPSTFSKYECEKNNDDKSVLREIQELQNQLNKF